MSLPPSALSVLVAGTAVLLIALPGVLAAWWLSHSRSAFRPVVDAVVTLPLALPPTAVGYALLLMLGRGTPFGRWLNDTAGIRLLFTWQGATVAAAVMSLPLFVKTTAAGFATVSGELLEAGRTLGAREVDLLRAVIAPMSYRSLGAAVALAFARALGEFGATLMVAGSIPGRTQTLSLAVYDAVAAGHDTQAGQYAAVLAGVAALVVGLVAVHDHRAARRSGE